MKPYGQADRIWIMDRGIPTEEQLAEMRATIRRSTTWWAPHVRASKRPGPLGKAPLAKVQGTVEVKLFRDDDELYVVAKSDGRRQKEIAMRRRRLVKLLRALRKMRREKSRDRLLMRVGAARSAAKSAKNFVTLQLPKAGEEISRQTFRFKLDKPKLRDVELHDGHYLLRSNLSSKEPKYLWELYILLVEIEAVFRSFKNDLGMRPVYHRVEPRVDAHIFVCFLAYCLYVTLKHWLKPLASGLTPRQALDQFAKVQMLDVVFPTTGDKKLVMSRYTQPDDALRLLMARMNKEFGEQPPPKLVSTGEGLTEVEKL